ncbi:MAG: DUF1800 domain-containing protein [Candidatus Competibacterales bacterium]
MIAMTRRQLGWGAGASAIALATGATPSWGNTAPGSDATVDAAPLPPPDDLTHAVKRTSFGPLRQELELVQEIGWPSYLERQLAPETIDDSAVEATVAAAYPLINASVEEMAALPPEGRLQVGLQLTAATLHRGAFSRRQLFEVMVDFWSNHFSIYLNDGPVRILKVVDDREVIRRHALGNFADLLHASAKSPAMLYYLDNHTNVASGPNENYARELMELHTLGEDGGYDQRDVEEVARCFTGWTVDLRDGSFVFANRRHDQGEKWVLGQPIAANGGIADGEQVLDLLARHPSTAQTVARKLCQRFIQEAPAQATVDTVAAAFAQSGGDIPAVLRTLFSQPDFFRATDAKFRRPMDFLLATLRTTEVAATTDWRVALQFLQRSGQLPFQWPAPNGYPDTVGYWANSNGLLNRWNYALALGRGQLPGAALPIDAWVEGVRTPLELVAVLAERLLQRPLADADAWALVHYAADGGAPDRPLPRASLVVKARGLVGLLLASPYFHHY